MTGGIASYPRTSANGQDPAVELDQTASHLRDIKSGNADALASKIVRLLQSMDRSGHYAPGDIVIRCVEMRNLLFQKMQEKVVSGNDYVQVMQVCANNYKRAFPISTIIGTQEAQAVAAYNSAQTTGTSQQKRQASEDIGNLATRYEMCALFGENLFATHFDNSAKNVNGKYGSVTDNGVVTYASCGASYNVNEFVRISIPNCSEPLILVGEAKGGGSAFGQAKYKDPATGNTINVSQRDYRYCLSRAEYMRNATGTDAKSRLRAEVGEVTMSAHEEKRLVFITVVGKVGTSGPGGPNGIRSEVKDVKWQ